MLWTNHQNDVILGQKWRYMWKFGQSVRKKLWQNNLIVILNNFFNKQFGQKIHFRGQFSHLLSMLWTNHQNYVILGSKLRYMSKFGQRVKKNCAKKVFFVILNNFFNRQFGQKIHYRRQFSHLLSMLWKNHQNDVILGPKWRYMSKFGQSVKKKIVPKKMNRNFEQLFK